MIRTPVAAAAKQATSGFRVALFISRLHSTVRFCTICAKKGTVDGQLTAGQKRERACGADGGLTLAAGSLTAAAAEVENALTRTMDRARPFVLAIWAGLVAIAWLGAVKPSL